MRGARGRKTVGDSTRGRKCNIRMQGTINKCLSFTQGVMPSSFLAILILSVLLGPLCLIEGKPTVYMKNENDKLEPVLLPVSSTVIPIPIGYYQQLRAGVGVHNGKLTKQKIKLTKPNGPTKLITVSGLKKMAAHETIKPH